MELYCDASGRFLQYTAIGLGLRAAREVRACGMWRTALPLPAVRIGHKLGCRARAAHPQMLRMLKMLSDCSVQRSSPGWHPRRPSRLLSAQRHDRSPRRWRPSLRCQVSVFLTMARKLHSQYYETLLCRLPWPCRPRCGQQANSLYNGSKKACFLGPNGPTQRSAVNAASFCVGAHMIYL